MKKSLVLIIVFLLVVHATCFSFAEELDTITDDDSINSTSEEDEIGSEEEGLFDIDSESNQQEETEEILAPEDNNQPNEEIDGEEFIDDNSTAEELEGEEDFSQENIALEEANIESIEILEKEMHMTMMRSAAPQTRSVQNGWDASGTHYYINDVVQRGFVEIEGRTYYFNNSGEFKKITGLVKNVAGEWRFVRNGIVDFNATGLVQNVQEGHKNKGKYFYVEHGIFKSNAFGMVKGIQPNSEVKGNWYYVQNGQYKGTGTGLVENVQKDHNYKGHFYYVEDGMWRKDVTGLVKGIQPNSEVKGNWYYVQNGQYKGTGTGLVENVQKNHSHKGRFYYVEDGKWRKDVTGLVKGIQPNSEVKGNWYYVQNGQYKGTGKGLVKNVQAGHNYYGKYYYIENGKWKKTENGFYHSEDDKNYAVKNGAWLEGYNGLYKHPVNNKYYYLKNGIWERDYTGPYTNHSDGKTYYLHKGIVIGTGNKVIYLTFDDGPGPYTERLINILDKYGAKATFFVTGNNSSYLYCIGKAYRSGHAIGNHTYSHNYSYAYSSESNFWNDWQKTENIVINQTGTGTKLIRFPGGSSNTISRSYNRGIMSRLARQVHSRGYEYYDWDADGRDAGGATSSYQVYKNIINGCSGKKWSIVLCHDIKSYTVDAIEDVIVWGHKNGYVFLPLDLNSPTVHHSINN